MKRRPVSVGQMMAQSPIRRREFCAFLGGGAIAWSLAARAQQTAKISRIGYFAPVRIPHLIEALKDRLRDLGYVEGKNLQFEFRFAEDRSGRLDELAADLVQLRPDVIVTFSTPPTVAVKRATSTIPVVMAGTGDPVRAGVVASLARPGGNVTGVTVYGPELSRKRLEVLKEAARGVARIGVLGNGGNPFNQLLWEDTRSAGSALGVDLRLAMVDRPDELDAAFSTLRRQGVEAVVVLADAQLNSARHRIIALAAEHRLPTMYEEREFARAGGMISYGPSLVDLSRRAAEFVDKILKGAKPDQLPVEQPTKLELVINLATAKALGVDVPPILLTRADEVIE